MLYQKHLSISGISEFEKQVIKLGIKEISSKQEILIIHVLDGSWYIRTMIGKCTYGF
jgi:hypothetical protein